MKKGLRAGPRKELKKVQPCGKRVPMKGAVGFSTYCEKARGHAGKC